MPDDAGVPLPSTRCARLGDEEFFAGVREWLRSFEAGTATTEDFIDVYEDVSGQDLGGFFDVWLREPVKPTSWRRCGDPLAGARPVSTAAVPW